MIVDTTFLIDLEREVARGREGPAMAFLASHPAEILLTRDAQHFGRIPGLQVHGY